MIRLNLGCGDPNARSWHPIEGWINRDPALDGWRFEHGLGDYPDGSVEAISVSHSLMYVALADWPRVFAEFARVLCDTGTLRVTEDDTADTRSRTYPNGWQGSQPCVTLTHPEMIKQHMRDAGLIAADCDATHTHFGDPAIMQDQHGGAPHCFYVEGIKMARPVAVNVSPVVSERVRVQRDSGAVLFEPHTDDSALFAAFTILKYRPRIVTCYGSGGDYGSTMDRHVENIDAMSILGGNPVVQWDGGDIAARMLALDRELKPPLVFACNERASHPDHVAVAQAARHVFAGRLITYHTYDANGKVRDGTQTEFEPAWIQAKLRALARFESQIRHPRACAFFCADLLEYVE